VWDMMKFNHSLRNKSKKSAYSLDETDPTIQASLAPMIAATRPSFKLKGHQTDSIGMMLQFERGPLRGCLFANDMGLGKIVQILALFLLNPMPEPVLVVTPASIIPNWVIEIKKKVPQLTGRPCHHLPKGKGVTCEMLKKSKDRIDLI
jgi:SNF2 family DNA or RNA helicase